MSMSSQIAMLQRCGGIVLLACLLGLSIAVMQPALAADEAIVLDEEDEDNESGFGIRLPWWGKKSEATEAGEAADSTAPKASAADRPVEPKPEPAAEQELIILDEEDEDGESGFGIPLRFWGNKAEREADAKEKGYEPADPESYQVIIDEEDETNESGFGIPLPTEDNPTPWRKQSSAQPSAADEYDELLEDD